jgi:hypothetical protein
MSVDDLLSGFRQRGLTVVSASFGLALATSGVVAAQASAQAIEVTQACVINAGGGAGTMTVVGSGFVAGDSIDLESTPPGAFGTATADPTGAFTTSFRAPILSTFKPAAQPFTLTATDEDNGATAATTFETANLAVATNPATAKPTRKVTYSFSGFRPGAQIYAHYLHRNKVQTTAKFGRALGACGLLKRKARFYPGHQRFQTYKVQFDDSKNYSPRSSPKFVATLRLFRL